VKRVRRVAGRVTHFAFASRLSPRHRRFGAYRHLGAPWTGQARLCTRSHSHRERGEGPISGDRNLTTAASSWSLAFLKQRHAKVGFFFFCRSSRCGRLQPSPRVKSQAKAIADGGKATDYLPERALLRLLRPHAHDTGAAVDERKKKNTTVLLEGESYIGRAVEIGALSSFALF
jgi:hypothetical protein